MALVGAWEGSFPKKPIHHVQEFGIKKNKQKEQQPWRG